ncbi:Lysophospholipase, alpha-beta hydrolase superfamily [Marivirga sericea]|uniref:Lysophospholipase, alpha-beta hydrolase superfamily n=1 Tax=Marivirga sericea TaxID=1028 RepID=A0A1X7JVA0_9BACT|nr:alpha/beta hydrolase [Marivirga sericea]SMG32339.1 Lysophospholipase, alpha-beta hydrolase superfamily [Marivirga sericea]
MDKKIAHFKTSDNLSLEVQKYIQSENPEKIILIVHGLGEHAGRFQKVAEYFNENGISVIALTLRGHGNSEGKKGHAPSMEQLLTDIEYFIRYVRVDYLNAELYLYGHSMGGNIILNYLAKDQSNEITAGIATSPWIKLAFEPPKWKVNLGIWVADIIPSLIQPSGLKTEDISSIKEEVEKYENDPLIHDKVSAKLFTSITKGGEYLIHNTHKFKHTIFLAHGQMDKVISHDATAGFAKDSNLFTFKSYPKSKHEIHNDVGFGNLMEDMRSWMNS